MIGLIVIFVVLATVCIGGITCTRKIMIQFERDNTESISELSVLFAKENKEIIDESLRGWNEVEYGAECNNNDIRIMVCNTENLDPLRIHVLSPWNRNEIWYKIDYD
eukprot:86485_1